MVLLVNFGGEGVVLGFVFLVSKSLSCQCKVGLVSFWMTVSKRGNPKQAYPRSP